MSDIYLQITETPTVVTLSAPVISGALSSTVTVANVVTVALDSNSLSALENVTVTVGAAVSISNFPASQIISGTVTANVGNFINDILGGYVSIGEIFQNQPVLVARDNSNDLTSLKTDASKNLLISGTVTIGSALPTGANRIGVVTIGGGTVTIGAGTSQIGSVTASISNFPASTVVCAYGLGSDGTWRGLEMVPGSNRLKVEAINSSGGSSFPISGSVTLGAGTAQIGSVTASISGTVPVSGTFFQATQPASLASLPALAAGTAQIGSVTASISGTVPISISSVTVGNSVTIGSLPAISGTVTANTFALQGTAVTTSNFTSTTASTVLANYNATREVLTIFNEGAGNLHVCVGATCTTVQYQVRLSSGDYYEVPNHQTTITHSAVFATAGTARVTEVS
jgi:hypothetical protein